MKQTKSREENKTKVDGWGYFGPHEWKEESQKIMDKNTEYCIGKSEKKYDEA